MMSRYDHDTYDIDRLSEKTLSMIWKRETLVTVLSTRPEILSITAVIVMLCCQDHITEHALDALQRIRQSMSYALRAL